MSDSPTDSPIDPAVSSTTYTTSASSRIDTGDKTNNENITNITNTSISASSVPSASSVASNYIYFICITGAIGVGKTTTYKFVVQKLKTLYPNHNIITIPEYIDGIYSRTAGELLRLYLAGTLSDACFQNYIQSYYINTLTDVAKISSSSSSTPTIVLLERCMSDSVAIFCNKANLRGKLTDLDFTIMYNNCCKVDESAGAPNYFNKKSLFSKIVTKTILETVDSVLEIIKSDLADKVGSRVIGLTNNYKVCYDRILERARDGESLYTLDDIKENCTAYDRLYEMLCAEKPSKIRVFDLGYLYQL